MPAKKKTDYEELKRAKLALVHTKSSVENFYGSFEAVRKARKAKGAPTDGEQDLVRAAVVFAAGGLDIVVKELIRGALRPLAAADSDVQQEFEKFAQRQLRTDSLTESKYDPTKFLAKILVSNSPYVTLIENYIYELTGSSLQSTDELFKAAAALDIEHGFLRSGKKELTSAFAARNNIIHELDVDFDSGGIGKRQRRARTRTGLQEHADLLIKTSDDFVKAVEKKLNQLT